MRCTTIRTVFPIGAPALTAMIAPDQQLVLTFGTERPFLPGRGIALRTEAMHAAIVKQSIFFQGSVVDISQGFFGAHQQVHYWTYERHEGGQGGSQDYGPQIKGAGPHVIDGPDDSSGPQGEEHGSQYSDCQF